MKSLKDFKCGLVIPNVDIKKEKNFQFIGEITIKASSHIYIFISITVNSKACETNPQFTWAVKHWSDFLKLFG